jgi:U3 small nucleolar RNA-associated protein 15
MHASARALVVGDAITAGVDFKKLDAEAFTAPSSSQFLKTRGWCAFDGPPSETATLKESLSSAITHIHAGSGNLFCVTTGGRILIYKGSSELRSDVSQLRALTRFDGGANAYSGRLRHDGRLIVAGSDNGIVRVFDSNTRSMMRTFRGHSTAVRVVRWSEEGTRIISGSNDGTARLWDLSAEAELAKFTDHDDQVRAVSPLTDFTWLTGCYDHAVRIWDSRDSASATLKVDHEYPVEDVLVKGSRFYSAGGNIVCSWDVRSTKEPLGRVSYHQKTVTSLIANNYGPSGDFIVSASLDGSIKVMEEDSLACVHGLFLTKGAILSLALTLDDWRMFVGTSDGELQVITRRGPPPSNAGAAAGAKHFRHPLRAGTHRYLVRGRSSKPTEEDDGVVTSSKKKKLRQHELHLKSFSYRAALDAALETKEPATVAAVLEELQQRGQSALETALSGRDETSLEPLLAFITRFISHPRFAGLLIPICETLLKIYSSVVGESLAIDALVTRLHQNVRQELEIQKRLLGLLGSTEMVLSDDRV